MLTIPGVLTSALACRSLISRCNGGRAPRQQQVRRRELQCLSESNRTELAKRSQLLTREQQPNETWGALSRYSYDDRAEDNEQAAESTTFPPRYKVVLACMLAFVVCNMVCSSIPRILCERCSNTLEVVHSRTWNHMNGIECALCSCCS